MLLKRRCTAPLEGGDGADVPRRRVTAAQRWEREREIAAGEAGKAAAERGKRGSGGGGARRGERRPPGAEGWVVGLGRCRSGGGSTLLQLIDLEGEHLGETGEDLRVK